MTDRIPGTKFLAFMIVCAIAAGYVASISGNIELDRIVPTVLPFLDEATVFEAELDEAAGLVVGDDVKIAGVDVGRVNDIRLEDGLAVVTFEVDEGITPTTTWKVGARWRNAIGQRYLYLYPREGGAPLQPGRGDAGRMKVSQAVAVADLAAFVNQVTPLLEALDPAQQNKLTDALNEVLVGREDDIQQLVVNLTSLAGTVAGEEPEIRSVIANANLLLGELNSRDDELVAFIDDLAVLSDTLVNRNDQLIDATVDIADVQEELGRLISTNDDALIDSVGDLREITDRIGENREDFEGAIASLPEGFASYMLTSRQGQWFNVRGVAVQVQMDGMVVYCQTESGTACAFPNDPRGPDPTPAPQPSTAPQEPEGGSPEPPPIPGDGGMPVLVGAPQRTSGLDASVAGPRALLDELMRQSATPEGEG